MAVEGSNDHVALGPQDLPSLYGLHHCGGGACSSSSIMGTLECIEEEDGGIAKHFLYIVITVYFTLQHSPLHGRCPVIPSVLI
ncbi:hypothetical protein V6N13_075890 [Hibiscus sabdariffa]